MNSVPLPASSVRFDSRFAARLERVVVRIRAAGERREGQGRGANAGNGLEFVGYRPYRPGEDLRHLDWGLYARLGKAYVRVSRVEASERWVVLLDASASMGLGQPGKLQAGAELAMGIAAVAVAAKASCELHIHPGRERLLARRPADLWTCMRALENTRAEGDGDVLGFASERLGADRDAPARAEVMAVLRGARRVFLIGDGAGARPAALAALLGRGRSLGFAQILAPDELAPPQGGVWEYVDAESGATQTVELSAGRIRRYQAELEQWLSGWRTFSARHRIDYGAWSSATPFEDILGVLAQ